MVFTDLFYDLNGQMLSCALCNASFLINFLRILLIVNQLFWVSFLKNLLNAAYY